MARICKIVDLELQKEVFSLTARGMGPYQISEFLSSQYGVSVNKNNVRNFLKSTRIETERKVLMNGIYNDEITEMSLDACRQLNKLDVLLWEIIKEAEGRGDVYAVLRTVDSILRHLNTYNKLLPLQSTEQKRGTLQESFDIHKFMLKLHEKGDIRIINPLYLA